MATPMFRFDPVELPPEALVIRAEVREFLKEQADKLKFPRGDRHDVAETIWRA
jgi:hypothetical protein